LASDHFQPTYLAVPADSTAKSIEDLKGKKVAIFKGTNLQLVQIKVYKSLGLTEKDFKTINMDSGTMQTAIATKDIDGGWFGPEIYPLVDKGLARIVYSTKNKSPNLSRTMHVLVTDEFEQQYPDIVQRVVTSILKESAWVADENNREENLKYWAKSGVTYEAFKRDHDGVLFKDRLSPLLDDAFISHYKEATAAAKEFKLIRKDIDVDSWFETKYIKKGLEELGLKSVWQARDANGKVTP
jgi:sulfonate transport system substrate-binding protein